MQAYLNIEIVEGFTRRVGPAQKRGGVMVLRVEAFLRLDFFGSFCVQGKKNKKK